MSEKIILILVSSSPFSTLNNYEALRATLSLFDHRVSIVWREDATYFTKKTVDKTMTKALLRLADDMEVELYVVKEDLMRRGIDEPQLEPQIKTIIEGNLVSLLKSSDVVMNF